MIRVEWTDAEGRELRATHTPVVGSRHMLLHVEQRGNNGDGWVECAEDWAIIEAAHHVAEAVRLPVTPMTDTPTSERVEAAIKALDQRLNDIAFGHANNYDDCRDAIIAAAKAQGAEEMRERIVQVCKDEGDYREEHDLIYAIRALPTVTP